MNQNLFISNTRVNSDWNHMMNIFLSFCLSLSHSTYLSCWPSLDFHSFIPVTCWTWWTMRSWLNHPRHAEIWSTRPSATTCCLTHGRRCRRPGRGRDSPQVSRTIVTFHVLILICLSIVSRYCSQSFDWTAEGLFHTAAYSGSRTSRLQEETVCLRYIAINHGFCFYEPCRSRLVWNRRYHNML